MTAEPSDPTRTDPYPGDENTDGAAAFERAARTAQALSDLPEAPSEAPRPASDTSPSPLEWTRVAVLLAVIGLGWLAMMVWDQLQGS